MMPLVAVGVRPSLTLSVPNGGVMAEQAPAE